MFAHSFKNFYLIQIMYTVTWLQAFLSNNNHFQTSFKPIDTTLTGISLQVRVDQRVIATKRYFILDRVPELEPHHRMQFSVITETPLLIWKCLAIQQRMLWAFSKHISSNKTDVKNDNPEFQTIFQIISYGKRCSCTRRNRVFGKTKKE